MKQHVFEDKAQKAPWILKFGGYEFFDCNLTRKRKSDGVQEVIKWMLRANDIPAVQRYNDMTGGRGYIVLPYEGSKSPAVHQRVSGHFHIIKDNKNDLYFISAIKCDIPILKYATKLGYPGYDEFEGRIVSLLYANSYKIEDDSLWSSVFAAARAYVFDGHYEFRYKLPSENGKEILQQTRTKWQKLYPSRFR